jgi:hypothetical protein
VSSASAATSRSSQERRSPPVGVRRWPWIASKQSLVREAKGGGRAIANHDMIDEGNAQQLPRVHEPLREGTIVAAGLGVA